MISWLVLLQATTRVVGVQRSLGVPMQMQVRRALFPPTPYDSTAKHKIDLRYVPQFSKGWECIPILVITVLTFTGIFFKTIYAFRNKVSLN